MKIMTTISHRISMRHEAHYNIYKQLSHDSKIMTSYNAGRLLTAADCYFVKWNWSTLVVVYLMACSSSDLIVFHHRVRSFMSSINQNQIVILLNGYSINVYVLLLHPELFDE